MEKILSGVKNIFLVGIGGIGVSGLAFLLKEKGFRVRGSDIQEGYTTQMLRDAGIDVYIGHCQENITVDTDLVCYSSAIKEDNPEIISAKNKNITLLKRGELLGLLTWDKKTIAVSGSHGKTTTTALIGYLLAELGYQPTVFVGGIALNNLRNAWWGKDYFVIETDESDGSFLYYNPQISIITNIDHEHLEHYGTFNELRNSFLKFAYNTKDKVLGCGDDSFVLEIIKKVSGLSYGFNADNDFIAKDVIFDGKFTSFSFFNKNKEIGRVKTELLGMHNVLNCLAVLAMLDSQGENLAKAIKCLENFKGTKRRFQIKTKLAGVTFVDDYAHHPTEIKAVLSAARFLRPKRLVVVFQPHRFSRVSALHEQFSKAFAAADQLWVTDIYSACEKQNQADGLNVLIDEIKINFSGKFFYAAKAQLAQSVAAQLSQGDMVIGLGAGDINIIMDNLVDVFKQSCGINKTE
jgi:UDP-N-acetylmuramate--alanine ligase